MPAAAELGLHEERPSRLEAEWVPSRLPTALPSAPPRPAPRSMSVSHPNCVTTYKLSVIRLLRGDGLLDPEPSLEGTSGNSIPRPPSASHGSGGLREHRHVHSLLSGAAGVEVTDLAGPLPPGLYETWMVQEVRGVQLVCLG